MAEEDKHKWVMVFVALAIVGFLLITSPGWAEVLGIKGAETQALTIVILVLVAGGIYWVVSSGGKKD